MNKKELIDAVAGDADISKTQAADAIESLLTNIENAMRAGGDVRLPNFGTFKAHYRPARKTRNPQTGATIDVAATAVAKFVPAKALKVSVATARDKVKPA